LKITVARHGETDYNLESRCQGRLDIPLNAKGLAQAAQLAESLADRHFDIIISSTQQRAKVTADTIAKRLQVPLITDELLVEICLGVYEGLTQAEAAAKYPDIWARDPLHSSMDDAVPGGESVKDVEKRVNLALDRIMKDWAGQSVLVISHGFTGRIINRLIMNIPFEEMGDFVLDNCEFYEYNLP